MVQLSHLYITTGEALALIRQTFVSKVMSLLFNMLSRFGCSPWGRWESDTTAHLHFHFSLSCTGGGNGNPLQCSCLENPRNGGAWWAAVCGVARSRTRLKGLSSSSSSFVIAFLPRSKHLSISWLQLPCTVDFTAPLYSAASKLN